MSSAVVEGARSGGLSLIASAITIVVQLVSVVVLSRLLLPEDFGLIAMVQVFIALGELLKDLGISNSALQQKTLTNQQSSNLFWVNVALAGLVVVALLASTPLVVAFYDEPRLGRIIPVLALSVLINGATSQVWVHLSRALRFRAVILSSLSGNLLGTGIAILLAAAGVGYWALVAQTLAVAATSFAILWWAARWRPHRYRRGHGTARIVRTGLDYWLGGVLYLVEGNMATVLIGRALSATSVGFYNRANQLSLATVTSLVVPLRRIVLPTLNKSSEERGDSRAALVHVQFAVGLIILSLLSAAAGTAEALIPLVLGPGWEPTVPIFQVLAIGGGFAVLIEVAFWGFMLAEASRANLHWKLTTTPIFVALVFGGSWFGMTGIIWAYVLAQAATWIIGLVWLTKTSALPTGKLLTGGMALMVSAVAASLAVMGLMDLVGFTSAVAEVLVGSLVAVTVLVALTAVLPNTRRSLVVLVHLARELLGSRGMTARPDGGSHDDQPGDDGEETQSEEH